MRPVIFTLLLCLPLLAFAKSGEDCAECGVRRAPAPIKTKFIDKLSEQLKGVPGALPSPVKVAGTYGGHKLETMTEGYPWNSIGRLFLVNRGVDFCTAVRVSACHVITNAHCVIQPGKHNELDPAKRYEPNIAFVPPFTKKIQIPNKVFAPHGGDPWEKRGLDWAVMRLPDPAPGQADGWLGICPRRGSELKGKTFTLAAYNAEYSPKAKEAYLDRKAEVIRTEKGFFSGDDNFIHFRANSGPGGSGGPLLEFDEKGVACVAALSAAGVVDENGKGPFLSGDETSALAQGVAADAFLAQVQKFIADNPCEP